MKIGFNVHFNDAYISGVEYYALGIIRALCEYVPSNEYVVFTNRGDIVSKHLGSQDAVSLRKAGYPNGRIFRILWEHTALPRIAQKEGLDILHSPSYICPLKRSKVPYVVTVHDTIALDHPEWCKRSNALYYNLAMRRTLKTAAAVIAVSDATADAVSRQIDITSQKVHVIHSGVDPIFDRRCTAGEKDKVRAKYSLPEKYILHVGNIEPKKNLGVLLDAYDLFRRKSFPHSLVLTGRRHWKSGHILRRARRGGIAGGVVLPGYVDREDLPAVYQMADLYVCTSLYEGFCFPPLEAMASGVPVVSSQCGALRETVGEAAYTIDPADPAGIAEAMALMLSNSVLRQEHIRRGAAQRRNFDWRGVAIQLNAVYSELVT